MSRSEAVLLLMQLPLLLLLLGPSGMDSGCDVTAVLASPVYWLYDEPIMELSTRRSHNQLLGHESAGITTACALDLYHRHHGPSAGLAA